MFPLTYLKLLYQYTHEMFDETWRISINAIAASNIDHNSDDLVEDCLVKVSPADVKKHNKEMMI